MRRMRDRGRGRRQGYVKVEEEEGKEKGQEEVNLFLLSFKQHENLIYVSNCLISLC